MTQQEKELLIRDICGRIPYGTKAKYDANGVSEDVVISLATVKILQAIPTDREFPITIKPYLLPLSSMTNKERAELNDILPGFTIDSRDRLVVNHYEFGYEIDMDDVIKAVEYLKSRHFDYRGLIPMGLAIEANEDIYGELYE